MIKSALHGTPAAKRLMSVIALLVAEQNYEDKYGPAATSTTTPNITESNSISYEASPEWWEHNTWPMRIQEYQQKSLAEMYMASIYFALMTITTVGYGDVVPVCRRIQISVCHFGQHKKKRQNDIITSSNHSECRSFSANESLVTCACLSEPSFSLTSSAR